MKAFLHIGPPKTGTTSIQQSLNNFQSQEAIYATFKEVNRNFYAEGGNHSKVIRFIFDEGFFANFYKNVLKVDFQFANSLRVRAINILEEFLIQNNEKNIIFSGEGLSLINEKTLINIISFFEEKNCDLTVIYYYRDPIKRVKSAFQQKIKNHIFDPRNYFFSFRQPEVSDTLKIFTKYFSKDQIIVRNFDKNHLKNGCVVEDFCSLIGINLPIESIIRDANISMSEDAFKILYVRMKELLRINNDQGRVFNRDKIHRNVMRIYKHSDKLESSFFRVFSSANKSHEVNYLSMKTNFDYSTPIDNKIEDKVIPNIKDFEIFDNYFSNLSSVDPTPLQNFLVSSGLKERDILSKNFQENILLIDSALYKKDS